MVRNQANLSSVESTAEYLQHWQSCAGKWALCSCLFAEGLGLPFLCPTNELQDSPPSAQAKGQLQSKQLASPHGWRRHFLLTLALPFETNAAPSPFRGINAIKHWSGS